MLSLTESQPHRLGVGSANAVSSRASLQCVELQCSNGRCNDRELSAQASALPTFQRSHEELPIISTLLKAIRSVALVGLGSCVSVGNSPEGTRTDLGGTPHKRVG